MNSRDNALCDGAAAPRKSHAAAPEKSRIAPLEGRPEPPTERCPEGGALTTTVALAATTALLSACGGGEQAPAAAAPLGAAGGGGEAAAATTTAAASEDARRRTLAADPADPISLLALTFRDAARFLTQATMGSRSIDEITALRTKGLYNWTEEQFALPAFSYSAYLESQRGRNNKPGQTPTVSEEMSYEAVWQHWLLAPDQLRARTVWALLQIMVISNIAPDIRAVAMSSYMDTLARHAFGNFRDLLGAVTLHPAMGYYLNMLESEKENPAKGTHPNENYPREVLQLFSIGLVKLNLDGSPRLDGQGRPMPTYDEDVVKGFAKAFSGWSFGGLDNTRSRTFHNHNKNNEALWRVPMIAWPMWHSTAAKPLLDGKVLPANQSAEKDLADALDTIFQHPNVGPFIGRQLIQRMVTSNPSPGYIARVAQAFNNNGRGVRGDMRAVLRAVLMDFEARFDVPPPQMAGVVRGKQREPVLRFSAFLRGLGAASRNGRNDIHYLDDPDDALAQSPLLAPSVFNFYSPNFRPAGPLAAAGLTGPEFQITSETSIVGGLNFFAKVIDGSGYGSGDSRMRIDFTALRTLAANTEALINHLDQLFCCAQMSTTTRDRIRGVVNAVPAKDTLKKVKQALLLVAMSPDFVIQR